MVNVCAQLPADVAALLSGDAVCGRLMQRCEAIASVLRCDVDRGLDLQIWTDWVCRQIQTDWV